VFALKAWVVNPYRIPSTSMEPTLHVSDRVLANRFIYHFRSPHRGDIVVFDAPPHACGVGGTFVKRLIGLPGDRLRELQGRWFVNGTRLDDSYVAAARRDHGSAFFRVPRGRYFFLGDNRTSSCDSRVWGAIPRSRLIGPVVATYWPLTRVSVQVPGPVGAVVLGFFVLLFAAVAFVIRRRKRST